MFDKDSVPINTIIDGVSESLKKSSNLPTIEVIVSTKNNETYLKTSNFPRHHFNQVPGNTEENKTFQPLLFVATPYFSDKQMSVVVLGTEKVFSFPLVVLLVLWVVEEPRET